MSHICLGPSPPLPPPPINDSGLTLICVVRSFPSIALCIPTVISRVKNGGFFFAAGLRLKGHCHDDFAVLGQFCAEIITLKLYS